MFPKTEGFMFAIQDKVIPTCTYLKYIIKNPNIVIDSYGLCSTTLETIQHFNKINYTSTQSDAAM